MFEELSWWIGDRVMDESESNVLTPGFQLEACVCARKSGSYGNLGFVTRQQVVKPFRVCLAIFIHFRFRFLQVI